MLTSVLTPLLRHSDVTDGLRTIVARLSNYGNMFVERQMPVDDNTQHLHVLGHRETGEIHTGDGYC